MTACVGTILDSHDEEIREAQVWKEEWQKDKPNTYCILRNSGDWHPPILVTMMNKLKQNYDLGWLYPRMVYKRHQNLKKEMLLSQLQQKCMRGVDEKCHSKDLHKPGGECLFGEERKMRRVIYMLWVLLFGHDSE